MSPRSLESWASRIEEQRRALDLLRMIVLWQAERNAMLIVMVRESSTRIADTNIRNQSMPE